MKLLIATLFMTVSGGAMADKAAIEAGDVGSWAEFQSLPNPAGLGVVPIPALVAVLAAKQREKGSHLTEVKVFLHKGLRGSNSPAR
tara:strand:+ start:709 stop:966 length:258 start_codon:yes stop_codon:yes gene_type:complete